jgi:anti-sigma regulatory factor (Ser/Thr protein kinase)
MLKPLADPSQIPVSLRLEFGADFESARETSAAVRSFLAEQGVPDRELFSYELCIAEACYNAIEYAEHPAQKARPFAEVVFTPKQIELRVTDRTAGFAMPANIPSPSPMSDRGRGLFIIQSIMDEVHYLRGEHANVLVMRKNRPCSASSQAALQAVN